MTKPETNPNDRMTNEDKVLLDYRISSATAMVWQPAGDAVSVIWSFVIRHSGLILVSGFVIPISAERSM